MEEYKEHIYIYISIISVYISQLQSGSFLDAKTSLAIALSLTQSLILVWKFLMQLSHWLTRESQLEQVEEC